MKTTSYYCEKLCYKEMETFYKFWGELKSPVSLSGKDNEINHFFGILPNSQDNNRVGNLQSGALSGLLGLGGAERNSLGVSVMQFYL